MLVDKSKFLMMVTAIAAGTSGCVLVATTSSTGSGGNGSTSTKASTATSTTSSTTSASTGTSGCLNDTGTPGACSSECEGMSNCALLPRLHQGVAADVVTCLNALDKTTCSRSSDLVKCFLASAAKGCDYGTDTKPICMKIATTDCNGADDAAFEAACQLRLNAMTPTSRQFVEQCAAMGCTTAMATPSAELDSCTNWLLSM